MALDPALVGSLSTGALAILSQLVSKMRCYTSCRRDASGEVCDPQIVCGFMDQSLVSMDRSTDVETE